MELIFREAEKRDIPGFNLLMDVLSERADSDELLAGQFEKAHNNPDMYVMVAENPETHELVGSMLGLICLDFCGDCRPLLFIENVVTLDKYQGQGIGRKMFEHMENWGRERNVNYAVLCSGMNRTGAHKFYDAIGYQEVKGFKKYLSGEH